MDYTESDICSWYVAGDSLPIISRKISRSQCYVDGVLKRGGIVKRPAGRLPDVPRPGSRIQPELASKVIELYQSGISCKAIEKLIPVSKPTAIRIVREAGIEIRYQRKNVSVEAVSLYLAGKSLNEVACELGVSKRLILRELQKSDVERRRFPGRKNDFVISELYRAGESAKDISDRFSCDPAFVFAILKRNDVPARKPIRKNIELDMDLVKSMYSDGISPHAIGDELGASHSVILNRLRDAGVTIRQRVRKYVYTSPYWGNFSLNGTWEVSYAKILDAWQREGRIASWGYERDKILLSNGKRYIPDFVVTALDGSEAYHEIKGKLWEKSYAKIVLAREAGHHIILIRRRLLSPLCAHHGIPIVV